MQNSIGLTWTFSMNRKMSLMCFLIGLMSFANCSFAQSDYPNKPIKLVFHFQQAEVLMVSVGKWQTSYLAF
ncbi:MAG: hypothetical protein RIS02_1634 [Pseudomonadota bacterium]